MEHGKSSYSLSSASESTGVARAVHRSKAWIERWYRLRDRLIASPRFQRWAASLPVVRWFARRQARALFDLCAGFVYSQVLVACVELRVFDRLAKGPADLSELATEFEMRPEASERLLDAAVSLRLLEKAGGHRYRLGVLGAALRGNPGALRMVEHHEMLYRDLGQPVALLRRRPRSTELAQFWAYSVEEHPGELTGDRVARYSMLMSESQHLIASDVLDAYRLDRHRSLLDVAGGEGAFLVEAARRAPELQLTLFDLPAVAERARGRLCEAGIEARCVGGDVFRDPLPGEADLISLVRVIHDHDDADAYRLLDGVYHALPPDGVLLLAEPMADTRGAERVGAAYFGFYLHAMGQGRARSAARLTGMLKDVGFRDVKERPTRRAFLTRLLIAKR